MAADGQQAEEPETDHTYPVRRFKAGELELSCVIGNHHMCTLASPVPIFGVVVTPVVEHMISYWLAGGPPLKGAHVLEVGAGVGPFGIALAAHGADVLLTDVKKNARPDLGPGEEDLFSDVREVMEHNIKRNAKAIAAAGGSASAADMSLTDAAECEAVLTKLSRPLDFIVACQVANEAELHEPLLHLLSAYGASHTRMFLGNFRKLFDLAGFTSMAQRMGFVCKEVETTCPDPVILEIAHSTA